MARALIHEKYWCDWLPSGWIHLQHYEHISIRFTSTFPNHSKIDQLSFVNQIFQNAFFAIALLLCLFVCLLYEVPTGNIGKVPQNHWSQHGSWRHGPWQRRSRERPSLATKNL